jgi:hypothetical protein
MFPSLLAFREKLLLSHRCVPLPQDPHLDIGLVEQVGDYLRLSRNQCISIRFRLRPSN